MKKILFSIFISILLFASQGWATTYYVKNGGSDAADGLSDANAWQTINKVNTSSFNAGDNIYFNKGDTWREQLTVPSSGSAGSPITFGAYGSGVNPTIDGENVRTRTILVDGKNYITIQNLECKGSATSGQGSIYVNNSGYVILDGLTVDNNMGFAGIYAEGSGAGKQIVNCTISYTSHATEDRGAGIILDGAAGSHIISGNTIHHNTANGIKLNMWTATSSNTISGNTVYSNGGSGINLNTNCASNIVEHNTVYSNGQSVADRYNIDLFKAGNNNIIRYNIVHDANYISTDGGGIRFDGDASVVFGSGNSAYYNIVYNERNGLHALNTPSGGSFYNNTVYNSGITGIWLQGASCDGMIVKNNIVHTSGTNLIFNNDAVNSVINYNLYWDASFGTKLNWNGTGHNFVDWQVHQDANSPTPGNPLFISSSDFHLQAGSPAINAGIDWGQTRDYNGISKQGAAWDIGALEYFGGMSITMGGSQTITFIGGSQTLSW